MDKKQAIILAQKYKELVAEIVPTYHPKPADLEEPEPQKAS